MKERIGIYGGSFDPPTNSHKSIGVQLLEKKYVDRVWYLPCYKSLHGKNITEGEIRRHMLWEICDEVNMEVCEWELQTRASGRTLDVINNMLKDYREKTAYCDCEFYFILGMDNADNIDKFEEWEKVITSAPFIVINRAGYHANHNWFKQKPHIFAEDVIVPEMSSTMIRNAVRDMHKDGLPPDFFKWCDPYVFAIIYNEGLYNIQKESTNFK